MSKTTLIEPDHLAFVDEILAQRAAWIERQRPRYIAIMSAAEAAGLGKLGFALALRFDLAADQAIALLIVAPDDLRALEDILAWVDRVPVQPKKETLQ